jgi:hypothetical protein
MSVLAALRMGVARTEVNLTLPVAELNVFTHLWGGAIVSQTDVPGPGVEFNLTGLSSSSGSGYGNNFPVNPLAGGSLDDKGHYGDFSRFTNYRLVIKNQGTNDVAVHLYMNTGYTGDGDPNTFWKGDDVSIPAGQTEVVTMDLLNAISWGAYNMTNGTRAPVFWLTHVSNIGFEVLGTGDGTASLVVYSSANLFVDPLNVVKKIGTDHVGDTFEVAVKVENVTDLYGLDIRLTWDDSLISYDHESYVASLSTIWGPSQGDNWTVVTHQGGFGYYRFIAVALNNSFTGSGNLFTVGFKINDPSTNSMKQTQFHFDINKLSNSASQAIAHDAEDGTYQVWGNTPTLSMTNSVGGNSRICRKLNEPFNVLLGISGAVSLTGVDIVVNYDKSMISYQSSSIGWGTGSISDDGNGHVTILLSGSGSASTLATITFKSNPNYPQIWKDPSTGQPSNIFASSTGIYLNSATLNYPAPQPALMYLQGEPLPHQVNPPTSDISYSFQPIKGDVNNDGTVDIVDLTLVAYWYDQNDAQYNLIGGSPYLVDIFDLVVVASNFWYTYTSTP